MGANLGDPWATFPAALRILATWSAQPLAVSSIWRTSPVDCPPGSPDFYNAVTMLTPLENETPESLLAKLQDLERRFGRIHGLVRNAPRALDLDLIAFGQEQRFSANLILPHPRAHLRRFVLQPLSELAPDLVLPGQRLSVRELLQRLPPEPLMRNLGPLLSNPASKSR